MHDLPDWCEEIEHTADAGIRIRADDEKQLFERAATGMFYLLTDLDGVQARSEERFELHADDRESLLVKWLTELNFRHITEGMLYCSFEVEECARTSLTATIKGEEFDDDRHSIHTEIKAVTYHGLDIRESEEGFEVEVIFDL